MTLPTGIRLGPYEILSPLSAGGMGEVYRARDRKLEREVAVKVLPRSVAADPDMRVRFEGETGSARGQAHPPPTRWGESGAIWRLQEARADDSRA